MTRANVKFVVYIEKQQADLLIDGHLHNRYVVSTAANGVGHKPDSNKTPAGLFAVAEKFGAGAPLGSVFKAREATGEIWTPNEALKHDARDLTLTRILWLEGLGKRNANTKARYIYIHGTNHEDTLGQPVSEGCVRVSNRDAVELFDLMPEGSLVKIVPGRGKMSREKELKLGIG